MEYYFQQIKNIYHFSLAIIAKAYYGDPSRNIAVIGVTGTDGKTTTTSLIYHILKESGKKASMISTVAAYIGKKSFDTGFHVTTPSPFAVQKFIKESVTEGDEYFVLETTSHALDQYRVFGIHYAIGVITNITHEHLLYHKTFENYVKAKVKLLNWSKKRIINRDDNSYELIMDTITDKENILTFGLNHQADYHIELQAKIGMELMSFNRYNYLCAYSVCHELGLSDEQIFAAMKSYKLPPGRMEVVYDKDYMVINDFAHTPNAIHEALFTLRHKYPDRRIIHIFGAAAFRDDSKRPIMGRESGSFADLTILTEEDYRTEDPHEIARQIATGLEEKGFTKVDVASFGKNKKHYTVIVNRQEAIETALDIARTDDIIIMTGKGHEQSLCRGTKEYPWDDSKAALAAIEKLKEKS